MNNLQRRGYSNSHKLRLRLLCAVGIVLGTLAPPLAAAAADGDRDRSETLRDSEWRLVAFQSMDDAIGTIRPPEGARFTLRLNADGSTNLQLDCNVANGSWSAQPDGSGDGGSFEFGTLAVTRALCPPPNLDERIARDTQFVRSFRLRDERLYLGLMADGGIYEWERVKRIANAEDSDPARLGWMQGFPPPQERLIGQPDSNYFSFPKLRWSVCHLRELLPTRQVSRGLGAPGRLRTRLDRAIDELSFVPIGGDEPMTWRQSLAANYTDGIVILHRGRIVYERYSGCLEEAGKHGAMSMTKSLTGLLAEIMVVEGKLDETAAVSTIVPELGASAFGDATVRQVMDMTTALDYSEDYSDPAADVWIYNAAANPLPKPAGYEGPRSYYEYLQTVRKQGPHGQAFGYKTINTDALGWILARASGQSVADLLSERLWQRIGAEQDAYMTVDSIGTPFAGGGLSAGLRDLARIGQLMLDQGVANGRRLFPAEVVRNISAGGDKAAFAKAGYTTIPGGSYRSMWWSFHNEHGAYAARGVHGQTIYIDPSAKMVIVRFASHPSAKNAVIDPTSLPAYQAVAEHLRSRS